MSRLQRRADHRLGRRGTGRSSDQDLGDSPKAAVSFGTGQCKWFNVRMGFGFLSMTGRDGTPLDSPIDVFVHQSKLHMEGFRSLKEGEPVEFTFKKSSKGLESIRVTGPGGTSCIGSERRPKGKNVQKRRPKGDRCYNCGGLDHHAKECKLAPQPKKCHYCQSIGHMVANCTVKAAQQQQSATSQGRQESKPTTGPSASTPSPTMPHEAGGEYVTDLLLEETGEHLEKLLPESTEGALQEAAEEPGRPGSCLQKRKKT
ncbi:protein lin-28 homolog A-like isoform X2 [Leucoraja erinacea]|uniref:protein lin-28 homolog A-like isoform X2 n=1 Tax=Leucoraja erinaceus TaxID=7782 RepID=UPI0024590AE7|nr:protein lin-28 homolog A-like isoform X2 [Leucoraja erinacea]